MALSPHLKHLRTVLPLRTVLAVAFAYVLGLQAFFLAAAPMHETVGFKTVLCTQNSGTPAKQGHSNHDHACCTSARCGTVFAGLDTPSTATVLPRIAIFIRPERRHTCIANDRAEILALSARGPPATV